MIGQKFLKMQFEKFNLTNLPKSLLFIGVEGSGKKTFIHWFADSLVLQVVEIDGSADSVRDITNMCNKMLNATIYLIPEVDKMSMAAQNSLLKVLEEPPENAYFMLTSSQDDLVLSTIKSRCFSYRMDQYSREELEEYMRDKNYTEFIDDTLSICSCPGEINLLYSQDVKAFLDYVTLVYDNIAVVSGANSFKIGSKINLAEDNDKYDLALFWRAFMSMCLREVDSMKRIQGILITSRYYSDLKIKGLNKQMCFDNWLLSLRREWM